MRIVITGGLGFIGSHLAVRLLNEGHKISIIDNKVCATDYLEYLKLIKHRRLTVIQHDITVPLKSIKADQVYHCACPASPLFFMRNKHVTMGTAIEGTHRVIKYACEQKARLFIASSSEIYGNAERSPQSETYNGNVQTISPRACYSEGKRAAETWAALYADLGCAIRIGRIFNTYGPGMTEHDGRVIPCFVTAAIRGDSLCIHGTGKQTRSFCYIDDMVEAIIRLMHSEIGTPVNLGNPHEEHSINAVARIVIDMLGSGSKIKESQPPYQVGTVARCPDITLASKALQWEPRVSFNEGLHRTIEWYKKKLR